MFVCRYCGAEKPEDGFYPQSKQKCKACTNAANRSRYQSRYRDRLATVRRERDLQRKQHVSQRTPVECAYAAGLIDGEGCVHMAKRGVRGGTTFRPGQFTLFVTLNNTSEAMARWLHERWPSNLSYRGPNEAKNSKAQWRFQTTANNALKLLDDIYPYLTTKRPQAKLARRFQRYLQVTGRKRTDRITELHGRFWLLLRDLNKRGL